MVLTLKHSGSLVTLSGDGFAAKNSLANTYTAGAALLLQAHYARAEGGCMQAGAARAAALLTVLCRRKLAIAFELVTGEKQADKGRWR